MLSIRSLRGAAALAVLSSLAACGGGGGGSSPDSPPVNPPANRTIGGTVTGLSGSGLVLRNNGGDNLAVAANGSFTFATSIANGGAYAVTVFAQPANPAQTCVVGNGSGTASANVTAVTVACTTNTVTISATVSGLTGSGLKLSNGSDQVNVNANGSITFATGAGSGARYNVMVDAAPADPVQRCTVTDGFGTVANANINVAVTCTATFPTFVYSINQGDGTFSSHAVDAATGQLRARFNAKTGTRPSGSVTYQSAAGKRFSYIANRDSDNLSAFALDPRSGALDKVAGSPFATGGDEPTLLTLHPSRPFLYAPNANGTSIAAFTIDTSTGALASAGVAATGSKPQAFLIEASGRFAYVAAPDSAELYTYSIDQTTGALTEVPGSRVAIGATVGGMTLERNGRSLYVFNPTPGTISAYTINATTGVLTAITGSPFTAGVNATFAAMHPNGKFIYVKFPVPTQTTASGLAAFAIDAATGALQVAGSPFDTGANPVAVSFDPTGRFLFAGHLLVSGTPEFNVRTYNVNATTGALSSATTPYPTASFPSSLVVDASGKYLYVTNQLSNQLSAYRINGSGELEQLPGAPVNVGSVPTFVTVADDTTALQLQSKFVYVADTANSIRSFTLDAAGMLTPSAAPPAAANVPGGLTLDPKNRFAYVANSASNTIGVYSIAAATGDLSEITDSPFAAGNAPSSVAIEPTGRYAYVASPGSNSVEKFSIDPISGALSLPVSTTVGQAANGLKIAPNGKWLLIGTSSDSLLRSYPLDPTTGELITADVTDVDTAGTVSSIAVDPSGKLAYVTDAVAGFLRTYTINSQNGMLSPSGTFSNFPNSGRPDGVAFDPQGAFAFTADGVGNTISLFRLNADGTFSKRTSVPAGTNPIAIATDYSGRYVCVVTGAGEVLTFAINRDGATLATAPIDAEPVTGMATSGGLALSTQAE